MKARKYNRRVELYTTSAVSDTYGGSTVTDTLVTKSWAEIRTPNRNDVERGIGIEDPSTQIIVNLRYREDTDYSVIQYLKHKTVKYIINSIFDKDLLNVEIEILATRA